MYVKTKKMPTMQGVVAGQPATLNFPIGLTYHMITLRVRADLGAGVVDVPAASMDAVIGDISLMVNGTETLLVSAAALVKLNRYYGQPEVDGVLNIFLARPWMREQGGEDQGAYGTLGLDTFTIQAEIDAAALAPDIKVHALLGVPQHFGPHYRLQRYTLPIAVTGQRQFSEIRRGGYAMYAMHIETAAISKIDIVADDVVLMDGSDRQILDFKSQIAGNVPQSGMTHIDFLTRRRVTDSVWMNLQDFRANLEFGATGNFDVYVEHLDGVQR